MMHSQRGGQEFLCYVPGKPKPIGAILLATLLEHRCCCDSNRCPVFLFLNFSLLTLASRSYSAVFSSRAGQYIGCSTCTFASFTAPMFPCAERQRVHLSGS